MCLVCQIRATTPGDLHGELWGLRVHLDDELRVMICTAIGENRDILTRMTFIFET